MKKKVCILFIIFMMIFSQVSFAEGEDEIESGLPNLQKILDTDEKLLIDNSSRYQFDGEESFIGTNILETLGNLVFGFYKWFVIIEIYLVIFSYKLELYKLMSGEIEILMNPITTVLFDTWKVPALLFLLLSALIKSFYSKVTVVINQIVIGLVVITISIIFLANPTKLLDEGENIISSINSEILSASSISRANGSVNAAKKTDDYLVDLANQIWVVQVEKPWEILNFNNAKNVSDYKSKFLEYEHGSKERDELTKELRDTVPERGIEWVVISLIIILLQAPKIIIMVLLSALNLGTDVMIVILVIVSGIIFLLALIPYFGIGVLINWFEKIISAFAVSVLVTVGLTLLNEITAVLYKKIDTWHILGVLLLDSIIMVFLIVFRKWIFGGVKALRYGQRGVKSAMQNTPNTSEVMGHVKKAPYNVKEEASRRIKQAKNIGSGAKKAVTLPFKVFDKGLDVAANVTYKTLDRFGKAGRYKEGIEDEIDDEASDNNNESNESNDDNFGDKDNSNTSDSSSKSNKKKKKSASGNASSKSSNSKSQKTKNSDKDEEIKYVKFSDYNERMKINKKYELEEVTEDTSVEEASKTYLNNQYKMSRRDSELEASEHVTLTGKSKPVSYDESTRKVMEREAKGEPLFTPEEVKKSEIHIAEMSNTQNISKVDYINKEEKINLNKIMSDEKTYNAKDFKNGSESKESKNESKKKTNDEKMNDEANEGAKYNSKHEDKERRDTNQKEQSFSDTDVNEKSSSMNQDDLDNMKADIIAAVENSQEVKGADQTIGNTKHTIEDIIKNDIEEKHEVEEINKKLDNINRNVERVEESTKEHEEKQSKKEMHESKMGRNDFKSAQPKFSEYSRLSESNDDSRKLGDKTDG